jgi:DNA-binding XRE family transcriptional regulator
MFKFFTAPNLWLCLHICVNQRRRISAIFKDGTALDGPSSAVYVLH